MSYDDIKVDNIAERDYGPGEDQALNLFLRGPKYGIVLTDLTFPEKREMVKVFRWGEPTIRKGDRYFRFGVIGEDGVPQHPHSIIFHRINIRHRTQQAAYRYRPNDAPLQTGDLLKGIGFRESENDRQHDCDLTLTFGEGKTHLVFYIHTDPDQVQKAYLYMEDVETEESIWLQEGENVREVEANALRFGMLCRRL